MSYCAGTLIEYSRLFRKSPPRIGAADGGFKPQSPRARMLSTSGSTSSRPFGIIDSLSFLPFMMRWQASECTKGHIPEVGITE